MHKLRLISFGESPERLGIGGHWLCGLRLAFNDWLFLGWYRRDRFGGGRLLLSGQKEFDFTHIC